MATKIQLRRGLADRWTSINPILSEGEMGIETDTRKFKFGDGTTAWNSLSYASSGSSGDIPTKLSQLENDCGFITMADVEGKNYTTMSAVEAKGYITATALEPYAKKTELPTKTSDLDNDSEYTTLSDVAEEGYTKNVGTVTSVNGIEPVDGNVTLDIPSAVTEETVTEWGFTKNEGTVTSVNGIEPVDGNVDVEVEITAGKNIEIDNNEVSVKPIEEKIEITDEKIFSGTTGENTTATANGCPYVMADYMQFNGKVLTSIDFLVRAAGTFTFGIYPNATDMADTLDNYSSYVKIFKVTTTSDDIDSRIEYALDGSDNRVTILDSSYLTDEGIAIPETGIVGLGDATETPVWGVNARSNDAGGYWRNSSENVFYATRSGTQFTNVSKTGNAGFTIKAKLPSKHRIIVPAITKKTHMKEVLAHVAMSENPLTPAGNTNAPYIYRESSTLQNRWITEFGFKATAVGKQCTVVLGEISGSATEIIQGSYKTAFVITADSTEFTNYKLDGSDSRVEMNPEVLTNGRLYVDDRHTLGFGRQDTTNDGWYCITNNNDQYKQDIVHPRESFYGTKNWSERPAKNYSTFNGCLAFNIKTEYEIMDSQSTNINPLKGKKISFLGDSITTFDTYMPNSDYAKYYPCADVQDVEQTWWMQIVRKGDMVLGQNCGWAGSTVTGACTGSSAAAGCSDQRIKDLALNGMPDIVVCFIGVNDIRTNVAKGNFTFDSQLPANTGTISTFSEAYALMVSKIMNAYRHTRVFCCSILENRNIPSGSSIDPYVYPFTNDTGFTIPQLNNCIKDICLCLGAEFVDLHACGINFWNMEEYAQDALAPSKACHPNANGCKLMADKIYGTIAQAYNCGNY